MDANSRNPLTVSGPTEQKETFKSSWKMRRIFFITFVILGTTVAYLLPLFPYQLPLCLFKLMTGYPCAGCGMTRSFEAAAHGRFKEAFEWHPFGLVLFIAMWFGAIFAVYELLVNKPFDWERLLRRWGALIAWFLFFALIAFWLLRLSYYRFGQWLPLPLKFPL